MTAPTRLPTTYKAALKSIAKKINRLDVLWIEINQHRNLSELEELKQHCGGLAVELIYRKYNHYWKVTIKIEQPTRQCLRLLNKTLFKWKCRCSIAYLEVVLDLLTKFKREAAEVQKFLLSTMIIKHKQRPVKLDRGTGYYGECKSPFVVGIYSDRACKISTDMNLNGCCHLEHRFFGSVAIANIGIRSVEDLIDFDFSSHWKKKIHMRQLISKVELGRIIQTKAHQVSTTTLRAEANSYLKDFVIDGDKLLMHDLYINDPEFFRQITTKLDSRWIYKK